MFCRLTPVSFNTSESRTPVHRPLETRPPPTALVTAEGGQADSRGGAPPAPVPSNAPESRPPVRRPLETRPPPTGLETHESVTSDSRVDIPCRSLYENSTGLGTPFTESFQSSTLTLGEVSAASIR